MAATCRSCVKTMPPSNIATRTPTLNPPRPTDAISEKAEAEATAISAVFTEPIA